MPSGRVMDTPSLSTGQRGESPPLASSPAPDPIRTCLRRCSRGEATSELHIKCNCTETWPQSNYARKQEEPLRLIWLFRPSLPQQPRRDAQGSSCLGGHPQERGPGPHGAPGVAAALTACLPGQAACKHDSHWQGSHGAVESSRLAAWQESESFIDHSTNIYRAWSFEALAWLGRGTSSAGRAGSASGDAP